MSSAYGSGAAGVIAGRYRLVTSLGKGGMGRVWLARDEVLHRDVAVKELVLPDGLSDSEGEELHLRTLREARAAARLSHPSVVQIHDVVHGDDRSWIIMEYVPARSLHDLVNQYGPLPPKQVARIGLAVLAALDTAHRNGVLHRDVKPSNVLITDNGRVVLSDFGLATTTDIDGGVGPHGAIIGSPAYIAPERAEDGTSTVHSDLWSLGATLYAAVEGRSPFGRQSPIATLTALATESPDPMRRAGPLKPVLRGLLNKDPQLRMTTEQAARLLHRVAGDTPVEPIGGRLRRPGTTGPDGEAGLAVGIGSTATIGLGPTVGLAGLVGEPAGAPSPVEEQRRRYPRWAAVVAGLIALAVVGVAVFGATRTVFRHVDGRADVPASRTATARAGDDPNPASASPGPGEYGLPEGWSWYHDPRGFRIAAPTGWAQTSDAASVTFREPGGARALTVGRWSPSSPDPVTAWTQQEARTSAGLARYQRVAITAVPQFFRSCADWQYRYDDGTGSTIQVIRRGFTVASGRSYDIEWRTRAFDWQVNQSNFWLILASFRAE